MTTDPNHHPALTTPGYEPQDGGHVTLRPPTEPGEDSGLQDIAVPPPGVPPLPCDRTARCALTQGHSGDCMPPPEFTPGQARYVTSEEGCERVRGTVVLPQMSPAWEATRVLHRQLRASQNVLHDWADVGDEHLGQLTHDAPGLHAAVMNVSSFGMQAAERLDRAVGKPTEWAATFEAIVSEAHKVRAFRLLALASGALLAGPFTETWDNAVEWCLAFWGRR